MEILEDDRFLASEEEYGTEVEKRYQNFPLKRMVVATALQLCVNGRLVRYLNHNLKARLPLAWKVRAVFAAGIPADWALQVLMGPKRSVEKVLCVLTVYWVLSKTFLHSRKTSWSKAFLLIALTRMTTEIGMDIFNLLFAIGSRNFSKSLSDRPSSRNQRHLALTYPTDNQSNTHSSPSSVGGNESGGEED